MAHEDLLDGHLREETPLAKRRPASLRPTAADFCPPLVAGPNRTWLHCSNIGSLTGQDKCMASDELTGTYYFPRARPSGFAGFRFWFSLPFTFGLGIYISASEIRAWVNEGMAPDKTGNFLRIPQWISVSHDDAYLWLTASGVLVLATTAVANLPFGGSPPKTKDIQLRARYKAYQKSRREATKNLMRAGSLFSSSFGLFVSIAGASSYLQHDRHQPGAELSTVVTSTVVMLSLGLLLIVVVGLYNFAGWWYAPDWLGPYKPTIEPDRFKLVNKYLGNGEPQGWARRTSPYWLCLLVPAIELLVVLTYGTLRYSFEDFPPSNRILAVYIEYIFLFSVLFFSWSGLYYWRMGHNRVKFDRASGERQNVRSALALLLWSTLFVLALAFPLGLGQRTDVVVIPSVLSLGLIIFTSLSSVRGHKIDSYGVRAFAVSRLAGLRKKSYRPMSISDYEAALARRDDPSAPSG